MEYIYKVLGIKVTNVNTKIQHLPNYITARYELKIVLMDKQKVIFLYPKTELEPIATLKKHIDSIKEKENLPIVLILKEITSRQKEYLFKDKIPFVVENKQIYLPFMALYLQEKCSAEKIEHEEILPSAQLLLLYFIYSGACELATSQAANDLELTPTSISRASKQLEDMGLIQTKKVGVQKILFSNDCAKTLFEKTQNKLLNPVKRTIYISKELLEKDLLKSGYSALSKYSMLSDTSLKYYASDSISKWNNAIENGLQDPRCQVAVQLWRYDPKKLSKRNAVDELSLALSLKDEDDERVEEAIEEMLDNLWRKIDGNRN